MSVKGDHQEPKILMSIKYDDDDNDDDDFAVSIFCHASYALTLFIPKDVFTPFFFFFFFIFSWCNSTTQVRSPDIARFRRPGACAPAPARSCHRARSRRAGRRQQQIQLRRDPGAARPAVRCCHSLTTPTLPFSHVESPRQEGGG